MEKKEKVKDFNQRFNHILNKFLENIKPHDSITIDYYTSTLPASVTQFVKRTVKQTLMENNEDATTIEKDLCAIGFISNDKPINDSKDIGKMSQASMSKAKEKELSHIKTLTCLVKALSNEMEELKQSSSETTISNKPPRFNLFRRTTNFGSSNKQLTNFMPRSNVVLNIEHLDIDQYYSYHQEHHSEKMCPLQNQAMNILAMHLSDAVMVEEQIDPTEEKE